MTFWGDEWVLVFNRHDLTTDALLAPHVDHLIAIVVAIYVLLLQVVGLHTYLPYLAVAWAAHFACVALIYRIVDRRCGPYVGVAAALSILFLGSAWEDFFHAFQMQYLLAAAFGLAAIDLLDIDHPRFGRVALAATTLVLAVVSSNVGPLCIGVVIVWGVLRREPRVLGAALPAIAIYGAWYVATRDQRAVFAPPPPLDAIVGTLIGVGSPVAGILGLPPARFAVLGVTIAIAAVLMAAFRFSRGWRPDPLAIAGAAGVVAEYGLQAVLRGDLGIEHGTRSGYVYPGAVFLWLAIAGTIGRRIEPSPRVALIGAAVLAFAILGNMRQFVGAARGDKLVHATEVAGLRMIEEVASTPGANLDVMSSEYAFASVRPAAYLDAIARYGRPDVAFDWRADADQAAVDAFRTLILCTTSAAIAAERAVDTAGPCGFAFGTRKHAYRTAAPAPGLVFPRRGRAGSAPRVGELPAAVRSTGERS